MNIEDLAGLVAAAWAEGGVVAVLTGGTELFLSIFAEAAGGVFAVTLSSLVFGFVVAWLVKVRRGATRG